MARKDQIIKIKVAQTQLKLNDEDYHSILSGFGVASCTELNDKQADKLIETFINMGWQLKANPKKQTEKETSFGTGSSKYNSLGNRKGFASPSKLRLIEKLWRLNSRLKDDESLRSFIKRLTGRDDITWLNHGQAKAVITAIQNLNSKEVSNAVS